MSETKSSLEELKQKRSEAQLLRAQRNDAKKNTNATNGAGGDSTRPQSNRQRLKLPTGKQERSSIASPRSKPQTSRFGKPNVNKTTSSNASNSTNEFSEDSEETSSDEENSTTNGSSNAGKKLVPKLLESPNMMQLFSEGASTAVQAPEQTVTTSKKVTTDLADRWAEMGTVNVKDQMTQITAQGFYLSAGASTHHGGGNRNLRLEARLHHEIEEDAARDESHGIVAVASLQKDAKTAAAAAAAVAAATANAKSSSASQMKQWQDKKSPDKNRRNVTVDDVFDRSVVRTVEDPGSKQSMRTIRLCEGDNVTSFVMPPSSQRPIPITFTRAPKDMRLRTTVPTWLVINVQKIVMTDHPLFITEDYVCARLHKVYTAYLQCMRRDQCGYYSKQMLNQLNSIKMKKKRSRRVQINGTKTRTTIDTHVFTID